MSSIKNFKAKNVKEDCFALVKSMENEAINVLIVGRESEKKICDVQFRTIILNVHQQQAPEFTSNLLFCQAVKSKLDSLKILNYFISDVDFVTMQTLITTNINLKLHETVLTVIYQPSNLSVGVLEKTENGYKMIDKRNVFVNPSQEDVQTIRQKIFLSWNPKKIILILHMAETQTIKKYFRDILKSKKLVVLDRNHDFDTCKLVLEKCKWLMDKSYVKFHFLPISSQHFQVGIRMKEQHFPVLNLKADEQLPYKKSATFSRIFAKSLFYGYGYRTLGLWPLNLDENCHEYEIALNVDNESFPEMNRTTVTNNMITILPIALNSSNGTHNIPVITFYANLSFICVVDKNGKYDFLDTWNGKYGKPAVIGFDEEKPKFCENATKLFATKPSNVVYDLLKIMSMPPDEIQTNEIWPFKITKDSENPVLIEFENFDGTKTAASPTFLMALLLKEHLKAIKAETGKKPKNIGFYNFDELNDAEKERVKSQLQESCKMMKVECAFFVC
uniref:Uncharacterized protein n=1 Tax=Panagrolaimus sp. ES5 TaxID=591445 RepID=A0AC34FIM5_9BILA